MRRPRIPAVNMWSGWSGRVLWSCPALCLVLYARPGISQTRRDTVIDMQIEIRSLYGVVRQYHDEHKVWPSTLNEACGGSSPRCPQLGDDSVPLDSWGLPVYYRYQLGGFEIRSFGPDRRPGTADDLVIIYPNDLVQADRISGCYRPIIGWWTRRAAHVRLDTLNGTIFNGAYRVTARFPHQRQVDAQWYPTTGDSISLQWVDGVEIRMLRLRISGDTLRGHVDFDDLNWRGFLKLVKTRCNT
jgi:hypothetical protein